MDKVVTVEKIKHFAMSVLSVAQDMSNTQPANDDLDTIISDAEEIINFARALYNENEEG